MEPIPSSKGIVAVTGKHPLVFNIDLNGNGKPDWEEPAEFVKILEGVATTFGPMIGDKIPPHTAVGQIITFIQTQVLPAVKKV